VIFGWIPPLGSGTARPNGQLEGFMALEANVEEDVDGDGLGDESQDPNVVRPRDDGGPGPNDDGTKPPPGKDDDPDIKTDPYEAIRKVGPKVTLGGKATAKKGAALVSATNPYAFAIAGTLTLKSGKKVAGKAKMKLAANGVRTVKVKLKRPYSQRKKVKLTALATMKGPVGKARVTKRKIVVAKGAKPKPGGKPATIDGTYRGDGLRADWVMGIRDGVVQSFSGNTGLFCTKSQTRKKVAFAMVGEDPKPRVAPDGTFQWEATKGYGFQKLKFKGKVNKNGTVTANMMVEDRSPITGADPITGTPRIEFDYCFTGEDFTLKRK